MSVVMVLRFKGPQREGLVELHERVAAKVTELGKQMGCVHHDVYWNAASGEFVVIDEWGSAEDAHAFWATETFRSAVGEAGLGPPVEAYTLERVESDPQYRW